MSYLERLKQKISGETPKTEVTKVPKGTFDTFGTPVWASPCKISVSQDPLFQLKGIKANANSNADPGLEARRAKVLEMLNSDPKLKRCVNTDTKSDPENVILTIAIRDFVTFEMLIPKNKYDPWQLESTISRYHADVVH